MRAAMTGVGVCALSAAVCLAWTLWVRRWSARNPLPDGQFPLLAHAMVTALAALVTVAFAPLLLWLGAWAFRYPGSMLWLVLVMAVLWLPAVLVMAVEYASQDRPALPVAVPVTLAYAALGAVVGHLAA